MEYCFNALDRMHVSKFYIYCNFFCEKLISLLMYSFSFYVSNFKFLSSSQRACRPCKRPQLIMVIYVIISFSKKSYYTV